jgi:hypothetical protein
VLLQKERERQRLMKEKLEAEARAQKEAKRAELEHLERLRLEQEETARLQAEREVEEAEALRRQKEEEKAEKERGKKLRKAEAQRIIDQKKEEERRAKLERENRARLEEKSRTFQAQPLDSPSVSPPRQDGFGLFRRRKDEGLSISSDERPTTARPRTARQQSSNGASDTITPGGGGAVLGIDAPTSAVNGGERVCAAALEDMYYTNRCDSVSQSYSTRGAFSCPSHQRRLRWSFSSRPTLFLQIQSRYEQLS